jgi:uncharacterized protein
MTTPPRRAGLPAAAPVASPCVNICRMNPRLGLCEGCLRSIAEIADWSAMDDVERRRVLSRIEVRRIAVRGET